MKKTIGGDRLHGGAKMKANLHGYGYSSHDLSYRWRSSIGVGTNVPCYKRLCLVGDTIHINTSAMLRTLPTVGPLFGKFDVNIDYFYYPIRLSIGALHNNRNGIGNQMDKVVWPKIKLRPFLNPLKSDLNERNVSYDSLLRYLGIGGSGLPRTQVSNQELANSNDYTRLLNAIPITAYYDICKNYKQNKQEEEINIIKSRYVKRLLEVKVNNVVISTREDGTGKSVQIEENNGIVVGPTTAGLQEVLDLRLGISQDNTDQIKTYPLYEIVDQKTASQEALPDGSGRFIYIFNAPNLGQGSVWPKGYYVRSRTDIPGYELKTYLKQYDGDSIDEMRELILNKSKIGEYVTIGETGISMYDELVDYTPEGAGFGELYAPWGSQDGLFVGCYKSDLFNNWVNPEWIEEVEKVSSVQITDGQFSLDAFTVQKRVWTYKNRIAVSGGTYQDWEEVTWGIDAQKFCESAVYMGGMSFDVAFEEVVSTSASEEEPLGSLAGRGNISNVRGGKVTLKAKEPGYLIGIVTITPYVSYFQGNQWDMYAIENQEDLYKPEFAGIGWQDLITEQMAWWTTELKADGSITQKTAGKQPSNINWMTDYDKVFGDFCREENAGYMVIKRRYKPENTIGTATNIADLTTYIEPQDYNYLFAVSDLSYQPFWLHIQHEDNERRIMSAVEIPHL